MGNHSSSFFFLEEPQNLKVGHELPDYLVGKYNACFAKHVGKAMKLCKASGYLAYCKDYWMGFLSNSVLRSWSD